MDSFQARLEFTQQLQHLNASVANAVKCAQFAIRNGHEDQDDSEDLYSCIIEQMDSTESLNLKVNLLYFVEILCDLSHKTGSNGYYHQFIVRDLHLLIGKVVPRSRSGLANLEPARKVVGHLVGKNLIQVGQAHEIEEQLRDIEEAVVVVVEEEESSKDKPSSKDEILNRMEQDRERHKRVKENIWVISTRPQIPTSLGHESDGVGAEFDLAYEGTGDLNQDDYNEMRIENDLVKNY